MIFLFFKCSVLLFGTMFPSYLAQTESTMHTTATNDSSIQDLTKTATFVSVENNTSETELTDKPTVPLVKNQSYETFNYDLIVEYDPLQYKLLQLELPIPDQYANQSVRPSIRSATFYMYKTSELLQISGMTFYSSSNTLKLSWGNFFLINDGDININYYGLVIDLPYEDASGNFLFTVTYNIRTINSHLIIKYVDESGNEIYPSKKIDDSATERYDVSTDEFIPQIPGYLLDTKHLPTNATGVLPRGDLTVTYIYQKDSTDYTNIILKDTTIHEQDSWTAADSFQQAITKNGRLLTYDAFIADGGSSSGQVDTTKPGEYTVAYHYGSLTKYTVVTVQAKDNGKSSERPQEEIPDPKIPKTKMPKSDMDSSKIIEPTDTQVTIKDETQATNESTSEVQSSTGMKAKKSVVNQWPKLGEKNTGYLIFLGCLLLFGFLFLIYHRKQKK